MRGGITFFWQLPSGNVGTVLSFKDGTGFQHLDGVPGATGNLDTIFAFAGAKAVAGYFREVSLVQSFRPVVDGTASVEVRKFLVEDFVKAPLDADDGLSGVVVPVDGHFCARLQSIEHPLTGVGGGGAQVETLALTLVLMRLPMQGGEKVFVDELDVHGLNSFFQ